MSIQSHRTDYDLVIVGAGFAGLVCARTAAMRGLRVALLDRKSDPGKGVHTTGILVKEAADCLDVPAGLTRKVRGVRLYGPSMDAIDLHSPGYYFLTTDTPELLRWLGREAEAAGARCFYDAAFGGAKHHGSAIRVAGLDITTRYLIGADGAKSRVAEAFGLGRNRRFLAGQEVEYRGHGKLDPGFLHCLMDRRLAPGYIAWMVPGVGVTQVGLARDHPSQADLGGLAERTAEIAGLTKNDLTGRRSGLIPVGGLVRPFATEGVLLVGDAAGLVSPMTAGGIHNAFHFGRRAAQVVSDHLQDQGPEPSRILAHEYPKYRTKQVLRRLFSLGPPNWVFNLALKTPAMRVLAQEIYFHRRGPTQKWSRDSYFKPMPGGRLIRNRDYR